MGMKKIAFYDAKSYDKVWFDQWNEGRFKIKYLEHKLTEDTALMAKGYDAVCVFVNDQLDRKVIDLLYEQGIRAVALRCTGYNNVDLDAAEGKLAVYRVPAYSPYAVAEHAIALLQTLNRKIHRAYIRTRDYNFSLERLIGSDLNGKTVGVIGTGKIGKVFIKICEGFGMRVLAYDPYPAADLNVEYVSLEQLLEESDIISMHCPLTRESYHMIHADTLAKMKNSAILINTSRGALVNSKDLADALENGQLAGACLDVYEEETDMFFEDQSDQVRKDEILVKLISLHNVIVTSHQAYLTHEALSNIAKTSLDNLEAFFEGRECENIIRKSEF